MTAKEPRENESVVGQYISITKEKGLDLIRELKNTENQERSVAFSSLYRELNRLRSFQNRAEGTLHELSSHQNRFLISEQSHGDLKFIRVVANLRFINRDNQPRFVAHDYVIPKGWERIGYTRTSTIYEPETSTMTLHGRMGPVIVLKDSEVKVIHGENYHLRIPDVMASPSLDSNINYRLRAELLSQVLVQLNEATVVAS